MTPDEIAARVSAVRARIGAACEAAKRDPASVRLVAVTKTWPADVVRAAYGAGLRDFGENYAQEFVAKVGALKNLTDISWHFIGHVQTNKLSMVAPYASWVHTVDTARLADRLAHRAGLAGRTLNALVQVNVSGEDTKSGCDPSELAAVLAAIEGSSVLKLRGLMTIAPASGDLAAAARSFRGLAALRDEHGGSSRLPELSMGMTHDLEAAVSCGATMVRVGSAIFGPR